jgi:dephospho-CoA kinase
MDKDPDAKVFADVPLLFEAGWENKFDKTILVTAPMDVRLERVKARDGMTEQEIKNRMNRQMPEDKKAMKADFIMDNSKDIESLINKTNYILKLL